MRVARKAAGHRPAARLAGLAAMLSVLVGCAAVAAAQEPAFYAGRTLTIVVGFSPGGGYDIYARTLARVLGQHIPGKPAVIVQNMPGAGSLTSVRYLEATAPKDGTVITAFNAGLITETLTDPERVKVRFDRFAWVGSITNDHRVCYAGAASGIRRWEDLADGGRELIMGATGPNTSNYVNGAVLRNLFGLKVRQIMGFPGSNEMRLAIERGELNGDCGSWSSIPADWVRQRRIIPFVSFARSPIPDAPADLPYAGRFVRTEEQARILEIVTAAGELGRPYIASQQVPSARLELLQTAFVAATSDPAFLAEAARQDLPVNPIAGKAAAEVIARIYAAPPELVAKAKAVMR